MWVQGLWGVVESHWYFLIAEQVFLLMFGGLILVVLKKLIARKRRERYSAKEAGQSENYEFLKSEIGVFFHEDKDVLDISFGRDGMVATVPILDNEGVPLDGWFYTSTLDLEIMNGVIVKELSKRMTFLQHEKKFVGVGFPLQPAPDELSNEQRVAIMVQYLATVSANISDTDGYVRAVAELVGYLVRVLQAESEQHGISISTILREYQGELLSRRQFSAWISEETSDSNHEQMDETSKDIEQITSVG